MSIRFDKLTVKAQEALQRAQQLAEDRGHQQLVALHLLRALLDEEQGVVRPLVQKIGASPELIGQATDAELERLPKVSGAGIQVGLGPELTQVFDAAQKQADLLKDQFL
ncbi:MAG: ATP-dependent chaperone ClpB, partial [Planctomycetota bacterium]|nr:ATP-dependent chaperone ClpB [Planctomycetota bacterium]